MSSTGIKLPSLVAELTGDATRRSVVVSGIPPVDGDVVDKIEIHFGKQINGGGDIENVTLVDKNSAVITFLKEKVIQSVVKKSPHQFHGQEVEVIPLEMHVQKLKTVGQTSSPTPQFEDEQKIKMSDSIKLSSLVEELSIDTTKRSVVVSGIPKRGGDIVDKIEIHFGKQNNGGGDIESVTLVDKNSAVITFLKEKVIQSVVKKSPHQFHGHEVEVIPLETHVENLKTVEQTSSLNAQLKGVQKNSVDVFEIVRVTISTEQHPYILDDNLSFVRRLSRELDLTITITKQEKILKFEGDWNAIVAFRSQLRKKYNLDEENDGNNEENGTLVLSKNDPDEENNNEENQKGTSLLNHDLLNDDTFLSKTYRSHSKTQYDDERENKSASRNRNVGRVGSNDNSPSKTQYGDDDRENKSASRSRNSGRDRSNDNSHSKTQYGDDERENKSASRRRNLDRDGSNDNSHSQTQYCDDERIDESASYSRNVGRYESNHKSFGLGKDFDTKKYGYGHKKDSAGNNIHLWSEEGVEGASTHRLFEDEDKTQNKEAYLNENMSLERNLDQHSQVNDVGRSTSEFEREQNSMSFATNHNSCQDKHNTQTTRFSSVGRSGLTNQSLEKVPVCYPNPYANVSQPMYHQAVSTQTMYYSPSSQQPTINQSMSPMLSTYLQPTQHHSSYHYNLYKPLPCTVSVGNVRITVKVGDITKEAVDTIVSSTDSNVTMPGGLAGVIVHAGGDKMKDECKAWYRKNNYVVTEGTVFSVEGSGVLSCQRVMFIVMSICHFWSTPNERFNKITKFCKAVLKSLENIGATSAAIPGLGTGALGYPPDIFIKGMFTALHDELIAGSSRRRKLQEIIFVDKNQSLLQELATTINSGLVKGSAGKGGSVGMGSRIGRGRGTGRGGNV